MEPDKRRVWIGSLCSVIPGCGHVYFGQWSKGLSLLVIDAALLAGVFISHSFLIRGMMFIVYGVVLISSVADMQVLSGFKPPGKVNDSKGYIAFLLVTTGVNALPLLWQSKAYGRLGKVLWTFAVPVLAIVFIVAIFWLV
jgi:hypothetical protein